MTRYLIASGTQHYLDPTVELEEVPAELERIEELFVRHARYSPALQSLRLDPETQRLTTDLEDWLRHSDRDDDDIVVIYYTGHGFERDGFHYLATASTKADSIATAVASENLLRLLGSDARVRRLLVILDVCYAGQAARDLLASALRTAVYQDQRQYDDDEGVWIVSTARARDMAQQSVFTEALAGAYEKLAEVTPPSQEYLSFDSLFDLIRREFKRRGVDQRATFWTTSGIQGPPPFLPNPHYDADDPTAALYSTTPEIADVASQASRRFVGRDAALAALAAWPYDLTACVVTGRPGSGKSALLAEFVAGAADRTIVAAQARGKSAAALAAEIGAALGADLEHDDGDTALAVALRAPATIVIDSLDESIEPAAVASHVLLPLASAGEQGVRLVVGCRTSSLPALPFTPELIDLDSAEYLREEDVADYVVSTLLNSELYANSEPEARRVGTAVARRAAGSFAIATVVATGLAASDAIPTDAELDAEAPLSLASAFEADLDRWGNDGPRLRALLAPLAWARGGGLPWETLWAPLANALAGPQAHYDDTDVRWLLDSAGAYILETQSAGRTVFRVFHEELAAHLRQRYDGTAAEAQDAILTAILAGVPPDASERRGWHVAARYALEHLAGHALAAGRVDELLTDVGFLVAADVDGLVPALAGAHAEEARRAAAVYSIASDRLRAASPAQRAATLGLVAREQGHAELADALTPLAAGGGWLSRWADWTPAAMHRTIARSPLGIGTLTASTASGRPLVAIGDASGTIRVIDLITDRTVAEAQIGASPSTLVWLEGDHPWRLAAGDSDGRLYLWAELDAEPRRLEAHRGAIRAIAEVVIASRPVLVTGGHRPEWIGTIRAWDAETLEPVGPEFDAFAGTVRTVDAVEHEGSPAILAAGDPLPNLDPQAAGQLRVFDPITGQRCMDVELSRYDYASTIAVDGDEVLVSYGKRIERWNLAEKRRIAGVETTLVTTSATLLRGNDPPVVAVRSWDGIEFYDAGDLSLDPVRMPIRHSSLDLSASLAFEDREAIVATDAGGAVRVWDPRSPDTAERGPARGAKSIAARGASLVVVRAGELEVRAADTGQVLALDRPDHPPSGPVAACTHQGQDIAYLATSDSHVLRCRFADASEDVLTWKVAERVTAVAAHSDGGRLLVATATQASHGAVTLQLWDGDAGVALGAELVVAGYEDKGIFSLVFAPFRGGLAVLSAGSARRIVAWHVDEALTWEPTPLLDGPDGHVVRSPHDDDIRKLAFARAGELDLLFSVGDDRRLVGVNLATGSVAFCVEEAHRDWIFALSAGHVGQLPVVATADRRGSVKVWAIVSPEPELLFEVALDESILDLAIADGAVFAASGRGLIAVDISRVA